MDILYDRLSHDLPKIMLLSPIETINNMPLYICKISTARYLNPLNVNQRRWCLHMRHLGKSTRFYQLLSIWVIFLSLLL
jgi:hypothetical protein